MQFHDKVVRAFNVKIYLVVLLISLKPTKLPINFNFHKLSDYILSLLVPELAVFGVCEFYCTIY